MIRRRITVRFALGAGVLWAEAPAQRYVIAGWRYVSTPTGTYTEYLLRTPHQSCVAWVNEAALCHDETPPSAVVCLKGDPMEDHTFTSGYIVRDRPIGQVAYEAFLAACAKEPTALWIPRLPWHDLPPARQQSWDDMANAVLEATLPY